MVLKPRNSSITGLDRLIQWPRISCKMYGLAEMEGWKGDGLDPISKIEDTGCIIENV